jgi:hypothetical protein
MILYQDILITITYFIYICIKKKTSSDSPLDRDKIDPLLARVANNAAVVTAEDNLNCY